WLARLFKSQFAERKFAVEALRADTRGPEKFPLHHARLRTNSGRLAIFAAIRRGSRPPFAVHRIPSHCDLAATTGKTSPGILSGFFEGPFMRRPRLHLRFRISSAHVKSAIGVVVIVVLFGTSVQAADLPVAPSSAPIPVSTPNWTGPYVGLDFGMRYDAVD